MGSSTHFWALLHVRPSSTCGLVQIPLSAARVGVCGEEWDAVVFGREAVFCEWLELVLVDGSVRGGFQQAQGKVDVSERCQNGTHCLQDFGCQ